MGLDLAFARVMDPQCTSTVSRELALAGRSSLLRLSIRLFTHRVPGVSDPRRDDPSVLGFRRPGCRKSRIVIRVFNLSRALFIDSTGWDSAFYPCDPCLAFDRWPVKRTR